MALRKTIVKRLVNKSCIYGYRVLSPAVTLEHSPSAHTLVPPNAVKTNSHREYITSPEFTDKGFFHKILQRRAINQSASSFPHFLWAPVGEKMREKLRNINIAGDRLRLDGLAPSLQDPKTEAAMETTGGSLYGLTVDDARKLLRLAQMEKLKLKLRETQKNSISYNEFVRFCIDSCENESQGVEFAKSLDESGNVIVLGSIVFLRPEQV